MKKALLIGVSHFEEQSLSRLLAPEEDVRELGKVIRNPDIAGFKVKTLINIDSKKALHKLETFLLDANPDDHLLIYYSGHGIKDDHGRLFLATCDTNTRYLWSTSLSARQISDILNDCKSKQQILIFDCCYSGAFPKDFLRKGGGNVGIAEVFQSKGRVILASSNSIQYSLEDSVDNDLEQAISLFTMGLINGLKTGLADANSDGIITIDEIYEYVFDYVRQKTTIQTPQKWAFGVEGNIIFGYVTNPKQTLRVQPSNEMMFHLTGVYKRKVDTLNRMTVPRVFLPYISNGTYILKGENQNLVIYPNQKFLKMVESIDGMESPLDPKKRSFRRDFFSSAYAIELDTKNRISIPNHLRQYAKLYRDVIICGAGDHVEIWDSNYWINYSKELGEK